MMDDIEKQIVKVKSRYLQYIRRKEINQNLQNKNFSLW